MDNIGCGKCWGLAQEIETGGLDEVLCVWCGQHYYKSTNHAGPWKVYVVTSCGECRWLPNTDGFDWLEYECHACDNIYTYRRTTNWELDEQAKAKRHLSRNSSSKLS